MRFDTEAIHVGQEPDPQTGSVTVPIYATSTFAQEGPGQHRGYEYSRVANPTRTALEEVMACLEQTGPDGGALATASGMSATALIGYLLRPGDHIVLPHDAYGGTFRFFVQVLGEQGIETSAVDLSDANQLEAALTPKTRLVWMETPTNPRMAVIDIAAVAQISHGYSAEMMVVVDNTFATPYLQLPLSMGADLVLHSATKYLGGHSDVVGGVLVASKPELLERLRFLNRAVGPTASPFESWLILRGVKTLGIRMERHCANAGELARFLSEHPQVAQVWYPGLADNPDRGLAAKQMKDFGGMLSFQPNGGVDQARKVVTSTELFFLAESLGGVESLIEIPALMTHLSVEGTPLEVPPDLIRVSVGLEHIDDLKADLDRALS